MHRSFLIPIGEISGIELASTKREREHQAELLRVQQQHEQDLEDERQAIAAERELARKYGRTNARLILNGEIRLGFTRAMVEEAWGSPYETTTVTNYNGSVECWIYGLGTYVYFSGNNVVQIIN